MVLSYLQQMRQKNSSFASMRVCTRGHRFSLQNSPKLREQKKKSKEKFTHSDLYRYNMPRAHTERQKQVTLRTKKKKKLVILFVSRLSSTSTTRCFIARERKRKGSSRLQPLRNCTDRSRLAVPTFAVSTAATSRTRSRQKPKLHPRRVAEGLAQLRAAGLNARSQRRKHARLCAPDI